MTTLVIHDLKLVEARLMFAAYNLLPREKEDLLNPNLDPMPRSFTSASVKKWRLFLLFRRHICISVMSFWVLTGTYLVTLAWQHYWLTQQWKEHLLVWYRRQVNKGDLEIALLHVKTPYHKAIWTRNDIIQHCTAIMYYSEKHCRRALTNSKNVNAVFINKFALKGGSTNTVFIRLTALGAY